MRAEGLEPPRLAAPAPKAGVSTDSTTPAALDPHRTSALPLSVRCRNRTTECTNTCSHPARTEIAPGRYDVRPWGTGLMVTMAVSKTADWGSIPWSPADSPA